MHVYVTIYLSGACSIYKCIRVYVSLYVYEFIYLTATLAGKHSVLYIYMCAYGCLYVCICVYMYVCMHVYMCMYIDTEDIPSQSRT